MGNKDQAKLVMKRLRAAGTSAFRATAAQTNANIVERTPVLTGRARAHWYLAANKAYAPITAETDPDGSSAKARGAEAAQELQLGDIAYIANNLPYIEKLENGSSDQAPNGMLAMARMEAPRIFQREFRKASKS